MSKLKQEIKQIRRDFIADEVERLFNSLKLKKQYHRRGEGSFDDDYDAYKLANDQN